MTRTDADWLSFRQFLERFDVGGVTDQRGEGAFRWTRKSAIDDPFTSIWTFCFFDHVAFSALVSESEIE